MIKNSREIIKRLKADGWIQIDGAGDHCQFVHPDKPGKVTVPHPVKDLNPKTVRSIERQSGLTLR
jgi:predicted RNA binding protein YcfA (HicA-like mRNA interferase family)